MISASVNSCTYKPRLLLGGYTLLLFFTGAKADSPDTMASVHGTVTNAVTGGGLRKAYMLLSRVGGSGPAYSAVTSDQGTFTIENVAPGNYRLNAECAGFLPVQYGGGPSDEGGVELRLSAGQKLTGIDIKMIPQAILSGRVLDQDGDPWPHANVSLFHSVWKKGRRNIESASFDGPPQVDDRGEFRLSGLAPGRYYLFSEPDLYWEKEYHPDVDNQPTIRQQPTWYPSSHDVESSAPISLTAGQQLNGVEIRLRRGAGSKLRIRGKLVGLQDLPARPGEPMWAEPRISAVGGGHGYSGGIQPDGSFEIAGVTSGAYEIWVAQGAYGSTVLGHATVQVDDRDLESVSIELQPPQTLHGTVQIEAGGASKPPRITFNLEEPGRPTFYPFITPKDDSSFDVADVGLGHYRVFVPEPTLRQVYLKVVRYGNAESHDGTFTLASYGVPLELVFSTLGARLSGTVTGKATSPKVVLIPDIPDADRREYDTRVAVFDQNGVFTIESIPPGSYKLYAFENVPDQTWLEPDFLKEVESSGLAFEAADGDAKSVQVPLLVKAETDRALVKLGIE